jgi:type II restriction/modification system DNA methylase subunit YeeA
MNRTKLKTYAPQARRDFIQAVTDRAAFYGLTDKKIEPVTENGDVAIIGGRAFPRAIATKRKALEERITQYGFVQTIEAIAYTWFNRLVAIRYMELHGYLDHGYRVLSHPDASKSIPEILEQAEHLDLPGLDKHKVIELKLEGSKEAELYRVLLLAQCNALHRTMPFLFEWIGDETELLLPENLLHTDSLIRNLVVEIDESDWQEVEIIGWLYQYYISEKKDEVFDGLKKNKKITPENIPAATQLFTPHWIVRYLVENSLGRLWLLNRPGSKLIKLMDYYIKPEQAETDFLRISTPEEIKVCDPACGSGHMLTYAFDLLYAIYEEEGYESAEIPEKILTHNLYGIEIDERAGELAAFALTMKARAKQRRFFNKGIKPNICVLENVHFEEGELKNYMDFVGRDLFTAPLQTTLLQFEEADNFGSLIRPDVTDVDGMLKILESKNVSGHLFLSRTHQKVLQVLRQADYLIPNYHVVIANPPYMGTGGMNASLAAWLKKNYPDSKSDLLACFMERATGLVFSGGYWGMINLPSWMFLTSFENLRFKLITSQTVSSLVHLGRGIFGSDFGTVAFVFRNNSPNDESTAIYRRLFKRLVEVKSPDSIRDLFLERQHGRFVFKQSNYLSIPGYPIGYWLSDNLLQLFKTGDTLGKHFLPKTGMTTGDDARFLRQWHEPSRNKFDPECRSSVHAQTSGKKWFPYNKGGIGNRWFGHCNQVVNWENDGREIKQWVVNNPRDPNTTSWSRRVFNHEYFFGQGITWTLLNMTTFNVRHLHQGSVLNVNGPTIPIVDTCKLQYLLGYLNSKLVHFLMLVINPTVANNPGSVSNLPLLWCHEKRVASLATNAEKIAHDVWDSFETSWGFARFWLLIPDYLQPTLKAAYQKLRAHWQEMTLQMQRLEEENNRIFIDAYGLQDELTPDVPLNEITLTCNPHYRYGNDKSEDELEALLLADTMRELVSYAVGCMFGRYALDKPGLILANQGETIQDYLKQLPKPSFPADDDNVIPMLDGDWFTDDIAERFRKFLRVAFADEHYEENLRFVEQALNSKGKSNYTIRDYFLADFYKDHLKTYKKRPIYWLFSSGKERAFQCLVYLHRYQEGTLARMRTEYVIPLQGKMAARIEQLASETQKASSTSQRKTLEKERDKLLKHQTELRAFDEKLRHYADQRIALDLDEGVKVNYGKFGDLLADVKAVTGGTDED